MRNTKIVSAGDYKKATIDKQWNNAYTQTSRVNRASFDALHKMIPFDDVDEKPASRIINLKMKRALPKAATSEEIVAKLVLNTPIPNGRHIEIIRYELSISSGGLQLRKILQHVLNAHRYKQALQDGKVITTTEKNTGF